MRVSLTWLKTLVPVDLPTPELVDRLDMSGTAVEAVHTIGEALDGVVVGHIVDKQRHPEADTLWVTKVDVGEAEPLQIVCGAQNFEAGDKVPVALVGATLPNGMTIKKSKLRGVVSHGMNCSATELGAGADASGLLILPADAPIGVPFAQYRGLADTVIELEVTPNRPDCLSMVGVAREVGAVLGLDAGLELSPPETSGAPAAEAVVVEIRDEVLCPRYTARVIRDVKIGPSPQWLAERVIAAGARPINNVVDVTNYVMFELGQPLHAFDLDKLATVDGRASILVRSAEPGEQLTTLDGTDRVLTEDMLVIADPSGAVALAGVMGGHATEVSEATTTIMLESACFAPANISRTSRSLGLVSESSLRFERGVDATACEVAADRACALLAEVAGGAVAPGIVDVYPAPTACRSVPLRMGRLRAFIGMDISAERVADVLGRLGVDVMGAGDEYQCVVPSFRPDLEREVDLYEEVVRIVGMSTVPPTLPAGRGRVGRRTPEQRVRVRIGELLRAAGLNETLSYSLSDPVDRWRLDPAMREAARVGRDSDAWIEPVRAAEGGDAWFGPGELPVELTNPMSEDQSVMRWTLANGLVRAVARNQAHGVPDVHLYEIGTLFRTAQGRKQPKERAAVGGVLAGSWRRPVWSETASTLDVFDGIGTLESLMEGLGIERWRLRSSERVWLQPGRSADVLVGGDVIGWIGEIHPLVAESFEATGPVTVFELALAPLVRASLAAVHTYKDIPRVPGAGLDVALIVDEAVSSERLMQTITSAGGKLLESSRLFDVYRGSGVPAGKKSMAVALTYRASDRTLTDEEVQEAHARLVRKVTGALGAELRG